MRLLYFKIILTVSILTALSNSALIYAGNPGKLPVPVLLSDGSIEYQVLKGLFDSGFFSASRIMARYVNINEANNKITDSRETVLISDLRNYGGIKFTGMRLYSGDSLNRKYMISWDIPEKENYKRKAGIRSMISLSASAHESTLPEALAQTGGVSKYIKEMSVRYGNEDKSEVAGYDLTMHTGFSQTHRFFRTMTELTLMTGVGVANYWINREANMEDWRYKYRWKDVRRRFRDGWSWDTNAYRTNTIYHLYAGSTYYQTARSNEYGVIASTAWAFAGSLIWEYLGEWREKTSANDMIITPFGGALLGEAFNQSAIYVEKLMAGSVYGSILSFILDPMRTVNLALDRYLDADYKVSIHFMNPAVQAIMDKSRDR